MKKSFVLHAIDPTHIQKSFGLNLILRIFSIFLCVYLTLNTAFAQTADAQTKVLVLHTDFVANTKFEKLAPIASKQNVQLQHLQVSQNQQAVQQSIQQADVVILDVPRPPDRKQVEELALESLKAQDKAYITVGGGAPQFQKIPKLFGFKLLDLYYNGGEINFSHYFEAIHLWHSEGKKITFKTQKLPEISIYHTGSQGYFDSVQSYLDWYQQNVTDQKKLAIQAQTAYLVYVFHPSNITNLTSEKIDQLIKLTEQKGIVPIVLLWSESKSKTKLSDFFKDTPITAMVNMTHIQNGQDIVAELKKLNIPMIQSLNFNGNVEQWNNSKSGVPPHLASIFLSLPETWGFSDPLVLSLNDGGQERWIEPQVNMLLDRVIAQSKLKNKTNKEKHIGIMFWNYPYGQKNLSASNLNIPLSIENIQKSLKENGYITQLIKETQIIADAQTLLSAYYQHEKLAELEQKELLSYFPVESYLQWLKTLPEQRQQQLQESADIEKLSKHWAVVKRQGELYFAIPSQRYGNLLLLPQPPRGAKVGENYHSQDAVPDPLYLATYLYVQQETDALIHLGTHGTQEWLPGKDKGLAADDYPLLTAGALPIFYPYVQDNIAEAMQAKRRGRAVTVSHQTAPLAPSGLYDELRDMHDLIHQFAQLDDGIVKQQIQGKIIALTEQSGVLKDLNLTKAQAQNDFPQFYNKLHDHLHQLAQQAVPMGLHRFGSSAPEDQRLMIVLQQLDAGYFEALDLDKNEVFNADAETIRKSLAYRYLAHYVLNPPESKGFGWLKSKVADLQVDADVQKIGQSRKLKTYIETAQKNYEYLNADGEMQSLLNALSGGYVLAGAGGDPIRQPESVSGRNLYAFEVNKIPTKAAYEMGQKTFEQMIAQYQQNHPKQYPKKIAFSLWSSETIRHLGVSEGQVLAALGLKPVWDQAGKLVSLDIIPQQALKRPRVDVVIQATSVYRDQFDSFMRLLAGAMAKLSDLNEPNNQIYENAQDIQQALIAQKVDPEQAKALSQLKIFSNEPGEYGSGLTKKTLSYDDWDNEQELANTFLNNLQYAYGVKTWGEKAPVNLFAENLKGVDVAIMSRSSNVHGVLSTDHPFEYLGGLSLAVRSVQGESPELLITDLRQNKAEVTSLKAYLSDELRTRYLNPEWIKSMQKEGYAGTLEVINVTNNLYGWNVTDPSVVRADQWQDMYETYVQDKRELGVNEWFKQHNPSAQLQMLNRIAEAIRQDYWQADDETKREIAEKIQALQKQVNLPLESKKFNEFTQSILKQNVDASSDNSKQVDKAIDQVNLENSPEIQRNIDDKSDDKSTQNHQASGRGLNPTMQTLKEADANQSAQHQSQSSIEIQTPKTYQKNIQNQTHQKVKGQALEQVKKKSETQDYVWLGVFLLSLLVGLGGFKQFMQQRTK
ncbi:cobaltochelatase subunit CobN [Acinetobacter sp. 194]|nr:cobaltochelatase subunit CobN [Acinetobacter shaoyimingii]